MKPGGLPDTKETKLRNTTASCVALSVLDSQLLSSRFQDANLCQVESLIAGLDEDAALKLFERSKSGFTFAYRLADRKPQIFVAIVRNRPKLRSSLLAMRTCDGWSAFHRLADVHCAQFADMVSTLDPKSASEILELQSDSGFPVAYQLADKSPDIFVKIVLDRPELRACLIHLRNRDGWTAFHRLLDVHEDHITKLLTVIDRPEAAEILLIQSGSGFPVAYQLANNMPALLVTLVRESIEIRTALMTASNRDGWSAYHRLADIHASHFAQLIVCLDKNSANQILRLQNKFGGNTVAMFLGKDLSVKSQLGTDLDLFERLMGDDIFTFEEANLAFDVEEHLIHAIPVVTDILNSSDKNGLMFDVEKIVSALTYPIFSEVDIQQQELSQLFELVGVEHEDQSKYTTTLDGYGAARKHIMVLLATVYHITVKVECEEEPQRKQNWFGYLRELFLDPRCFPHHYHCLLEICFQAPVLQGQEKFSGPVYTVLFSEFQTFLTTAVPWLVISALEPLFGGSPDIQSTHALACVKKALDCEFGIFGGHIEDDNFCPCLPIVQQTVKSLTAEFMTLEMVFDVIGVSLMENEEKWNVLRRLVGDDRTEAIAVDAMEVQDELFTFQPPDQIRLSLKGFHRLCENLDVLMPTAAFCLAPKDLNKENVYLASLILAVCRGHLIEYFDWKKFRAQELSDLRYKSCFRMQVSLSSVMACHLKDDESIVRAFHHMDTNSLSRAKDFESFFWHLSFTNPRLFCRFFLEILSTDHCCDILGLASEVFIKLAEFRGEFLKDLISGCDEDLVASILGLTSSKGFPVIYQLADKNPDVLVKIVLERRTILAALMSIKNQDGWTAFHRLADVHCNSFGTMAGGLDNQACEQILQLKSENGMPVAHLLVNHGASVLLSIIQERIELRTKLMDVRSADGCTVYHRMAQDALNFGQLAASFQEDHVAFIQILAIRSGSGFPVCYHAADKIPSVIVAIAQKHSLLRTAMMSMRDREGWTVYHRLADVHGELFEELIGGQGVAAAAKIFGLKNNVGLPVSFELANSNPAVFVSIIQKRHALRKAVMRIRNGDGITSFHQISESSSSHFEDFISGLEKASVLKILGLRCASGIPVAVHMSKKNPALLIKIVRRRPELKNTLMDFEDRDGHTVNHHLGDVHRPECLDDIMMLGRRL
jgi:hypothetical protein